MQVGLIQTRQSRQVRVNRRCCPHQAGLNCRGTQGGEAKSVSFPPSKEVKLPSGLIYSEMLPPETKPLPKMTAQQLPSPPEHQSENIFSKLAGKLKFKFWRRISGTASSVATEGQRDFQGTVDT
jgi:hypothetical protein